jgi:hypothetical protein
MVGTIAFNEPITTNIIVGISIAIAAIIFMIMATKK